MSKHLVRSILFLTILLTVIYTTNRILIPKYTQSNSKWPTTSSYNQFYKMDKNSIDVIFLGSSVAVNIFSPQEIYDTYRIRSYNLSSEQQSIFLSYYWLKEALRFQSPQIVILDTRFLFDMHAENPINTSEGLTRKCLDPMKWSNVKREAISELCTLDQTHNELSYYLPNIRFHNRWRELNELDFVSTEYTSNPLKGYGVIVDYSLSPYDTYTPSDIVEKAEPNATMLEYLNRITRLCKENNISLVITSVPGNPMNDLYNNALTDYAELNSIDYYNFCEKSLYDTIGVDGMRESLNAHANLWGSIKMSNYIGSLLLNKYNIVPVEDTQYSKSDAYYSHIKELAELSHINDINDYLKAIDNEHYYVFITVKADASYSLNDDILENLANLGLNISLKDQWCAGYSAVIANQKCIQENLLYNEPCSFSGSILHETVQYDITSCGLYPTGNYSSIKLNGNEYSKNSRGLNIVVYDDILMKVIDSVAFDTCDSSLAPTR